VAAKTPAETMRQLIAAFNAGDLEAALALYHHDAVFVAEPGKPAAGLEAIRAEMSAFLATRPTLTIEGHDTVEAGDVALHCTRWSLSNTGPDGSVVKRTGRGAVVLRRQPDGTWLVAVENPWADVLR
jgi:uncharacterized protein (TIGR02246 family)